MTSYRRIRRGLAAPAALAVAYGIELARPQMVFAYETRSPGVIPPGPIEGELSAK